MSNKTVKNGLSYELNGWTYVAVKGSPKEMGQAYGKLIHSEMKKVQNILDFIIYNDYGVKWEFFIRAAAKYFKPKIMELYPEFYEEMVGFSEGCTSAGTSMSIDEVIAWNNYFTLTESWWANMPEEESIEVNGLNGSNKVSSKEGGNGSSERCSGFIANGDWTADGKIVVAHRFTM